MIGLIAAILCCISVLCSIATQSTEALSRAAVSSCSEAIELAISLAGTMALWGGLMRIAHKAGLTRFFARLLSPLTRRLFAGCSSKAVEYITMNLTANMLGISNAATPMGIEAVKEMNRQGGASARRGIAMLTVLNTASIQLLPTTIGTMRAAHSAADPFDITLPILAVSIASAAAGCAMIYALHLKGRHCEDK